MRTKLRRHCDDAALVDRVLDALAGANLQNDARHAEAYVRQRVSRGYGPARIAQELRQRGVAAALVDQVLSEIEADWLALARQVRAKRFGNALPRLPAERARQMRFLEYRGFPVETIRKVFSAADDY